MFKLVKTLYRGSKRRPGDDKKFQALKGEIAHKTKLIHMKISINSTRSTHSFTRKADE